MNPDACYFDHAAGTPPAPEALRRHAELAALHGNPSASHPAGQEARRTLEAARRRFLELAGLPEGRLILTSGATEANNLVLRGVLERRPEGRLLLAADVHASAWFAKELWPGRVDVMETGPDGRIDPAALERRLTPAHVLFSFVHGNNETGTLQDARALAAVCAARGATVHADVVQALGRIPLDLAELGADYAVFTAHKFGGLRGTGGVIAREPVLAAQILGGGQEGGLRAGTENVAGLGAAVAGLEAAIADREAEAARRRALARDLLDILRRWPGLLVNSDPERGLPGLVSVCFPGLVGESLVAELGLRGFAASAGSACGSGRREPSRVVLAMGRPKEAALGAVRISLGRGNGPESIRDLGLTLLEVAEKQKALA
jgi:cysteine desulfurase